MSAGETECSERIAKDVIEESATETMERTSAC